MRAREATALRTIYYTNKNGRLTSARVLKGGPDEWKHGFDFSKKDTTPTTMSKKQVKKTLAFAPSKTHKGRGKQ